MVPRWRAPAVPVRADSEIRVPTATRAGSLAGEKLRGAALRARLEFVRHRHGQSFLAGVLSDLEPADRSVACGSLLPSLWYPASVLARLDEALERRLGPAADELFEQAGRHAARLHARGLFRVFQHAESPVAVLRLAAAVHAQYTAGTGRARVESRSDRAAVAEVLGARWSLPSHCRTTGAYLRAVVAACTGLRVSEQETACRCRGDETCRFELRWRDPRREGGRA